MLSNLLQLAVLVLSVGCPLLVRAHEFWLEPTEYAPTLNKKIELRLKTGENFKGSINPYLSSNFLKFTSQQGKTVRNIEGFDGNDDPAAVLTFKNRGLTIITYHKKFGYLKYKNFDGFKNFLIKEGLGHFLAQHTAQNKKKTNIEEKYYRAAKLLLNVGQNGQGQDRFTGMPLELVAEQNPYTLQPGEPLAIRLLQNGKPVEGALIRAFPQSNAEEVQLKKTDQDGRAIIPMPSSGPWLLNTVQYLEPKLNDGVDWVSIWASLTFEHP